MVHQHHLGDLVSYNGDIHKVIACLSPDNPNLHPAYLLARIGPPVFEIDIVKIDQSKIQIPITQYM